MTCADRECSSAGHQYFSALESYVLEALGDAPSLGAEGCGVVLGQTSQVWAGSVPCSGSCAGSGFVTVPYLRARAPKARQQPWVAALCLGLGPGGSGVFWISASQPHARLPVLSTGHQHLMGSHTSSSGGRLISAGHSRARQVRGRRTPHPGPQLPLKLRPPPNPGVALYRKSWR